MPDINYQWLKIVDFTPGIYSYSALSSSAGAPVPAPLGAAQESTFGCVALPSGGLAPLPSASQTFAPPAAGVVNGTTNYVTGALVVPLIGGSNSGDELIYALESITGGNRAINICDTLVNGTSPWNRVLESLSGATTNPLMSPFSAVMTMVNATNASNTGSAVVAMAVTFISGGSTPQPHLYFYPDPTNNSGTAVPKDYSSSLPSVGTAPSGIAILIAHQNRIVWLNSQANLWTTTTTALEEQFEHFYYTDPPNSVPGASGGTNSLAQNVVFVQEFPMGSGAAGSINAGELFMVKAFGGGYSISGDLNNPIVTRLPGVQPTGNVWGQGASTTIGFVYPSYYNGVWVWNGGSSSQKISSQLDDTFWINPNVADSIATQFQAIQWGDWIITTNNWLYDTKTGGWWRLDNQTVPYLWYGIGAVDAGALYAFPASIPNAATAVAYGLNRFTLNNSYTWVSYPLPPSTNIEKSIVIRRISMRVQGHGTVTVTFTGAGGAGSSTTPATYTFNSTAQPLRYVLDIGVLEAQDVIMTIVSTGAGGGTAPIVYEANVGYHESNILNPT